MKSKNIYLKILLLTLLTIMMSTTMSFAAPLSTATDLTIEMQGEKAYLEWDKITDATGYEVYINIPGRGYVYAGDASKNRVTIIGLTEDEEYFAKVRGYSKENGKKDYGGFSNEVAFGFGNVEIDDGDKEKPEKVENLKYSIDGSKVKLTWSDVSDVFGYEVHVKIPNTGYIHVGTVTNNHVNLTGFSYNEEYSVKIRAIDEDENYGEYSDEISFIFREEDDDYQEDVEKPAKVTGLKGDIDGTTVKLTWNKVKDADGYEINMVIPGYGSTNITTESTSKIVTGLTNIGQNYATKVRAYKVIDGEKEYGEYSNTISIYPEKEEVEEPDKVTGLDYTQSGSTIKLNWDKVSDADGYEVAFKEPGNSSYNTFLSSGTTKTITGLNEEGTYKFKVRAYKNNDGDKVYGKYSSVLSIKIEEELKKPSKVTGVKGNLSGSNIELSWDKVSDADGYEVAFKEPGNSSYNTFLTTATRKTIAGLNEEGTYKLKVRAYIENDGEKIYGEYSNILNVEYEEKIEKPAKVTGLKGDLSGSVVELSWNRMNGIDGYEVAIKKPGESSYNTFLTTATRKTIAGLDEEGTYKFKVRAYREDSNGSRIKGEYSNVLNIEYEEQKEELDRVTGLKGTVTGETVRLTWNSVYDADGYEIRMTIPGYGDTVITTTSTNRIISGLTDKNYSYDTKVRAYKIENGTKIYGPYSKTLEVYAK